MSSWTFENYRKDLPNGNHISASYSWNKCAPYDVSVGIFNEKGIHISTIFRQWYATKEQAQRSFKRQVRKIEKGEY